MAHKRFPHAIQLISFSIFILFIFSLSLSGLAHEDSTKDGPNLALVLKALPSPTTTLTPTPTPAYGIILISEVMVQPAGIEPDGEWVELYNSGGGIIDLSTYKLGDEETRGQGEGMLQFPAGARLAPGQVIIIANHAANFISTYGFSPNFEMTASLSGIPDMRKVPSWATGSINLGNNGDEVLVLDMDVNRLFRTVTRLEACPFFSL